MSRAVSVTVPYGPILLCNVVVLSVLFRRVVTCYRNKSGSQKKRKKTHCDSGYRNLLVSNYQVEGFVSWWGNAFCNVFFYGEKKDAQKGALR